MARWVNSFGLTQRLGAACLGLIAAGSAGCSEREQRSEPVGALQAKLTVPGLVAAFGFDEASGSTVVDATGNGHDTSLDGQERVLGTYGGALAFGGNKLTVADSSLLDLTTGMTVSAWIRPTAVDGYETVVYKEGPFGLTYGLYAGYGPFGLVRIDSAPMIADGQTGVELDTWSHVATTYDGSTLRVFVNGEESGSTPVTGLIDTSSGPLGIGGNGIWEDEYFDGVIDELRIYDHALTLAELRQDLLLPVTDASPDTTPPTVAITGPVDGTTVDGPVAIAATASDNVAVAVKFLVDGNLLEEDYFPPFNATWDSTTATGGAHVLSAQARDGAGNTATSSVSVNVAPGLLVAAYSFDEGSGSTLHDATGYGNDGVISEPTWTAGKYGDALSFDGVDDWVAISDASLLDLTTAMTLEAWIRPAA